MDIFRDLAPAVFHRFDRRLVGGRDDVVQFPKGLLCGQSELAEVIGVLVPDIKAGPGDASTSRR